MLQELEKQYQGEIEKLQKKLKWYAENQELLDKGTKKIKARDEEIHKLKMRIEELQTEVSNTVFICPSSEGCVTARCSTSNVSLSVCPKTTDFYTFSLFV